MAADAPDTGKIVTFYSYKGGTGRTMALANVGWIMASNGLRVLLVDWDLEAPGLHRYLHPLLPLDPELLISDGLINMVQAYVKEVLSPGEPVARTSGGTAPHPTIEGEDWLRARAQLRPYTTGLELDLPAGGRLDFLPAGRQSAAYSAAVTSFNWSSFYERLSGGSFLQVLRAEMAAAYDYVLIDSRTGVSDTSGICTILMPDALVDCFTFGAQSIRGGVDIARSVTRSAQRDIRILPVPMRVEDAEQERLEAGRDYAREEFEPFLAWLGERQRDRYWGDVEIPYKPFYAYEEVPATVADRPLQEGSLLAAFERLTEWITRGRVRSLEPLPADDRRRLSAAYLRTRRTAPTRVFVSYTPVDRMWAEWAAGHLEAAGYQVSLHSTADPGSGAPPEVTGAAREGRARVLALLSPAYVAQARAADVISRLDGLHTVGGPALVAVRVQDLESPAAGPFLGLHAADLTRYTAAEAGAQLLAAVGLRRGRGGALRGTLASGTAQPRFPGTQPVVQRVPAHNMYFTGRARFLELLRHRFTAGTAAVPYQVLYGLSGMGKTQTALEYAHRFKSAYDVVWWMSATQRQLIPPALADLAPSLGIEESEDIGSTAASVLHALSAGQPYGRWLLIYDNAGSPEELTGLFPETPPANGHVLITSRDRAWAKTAGLIELDTFDRDESVELLRRFNPALSDPEAEQLASELGDLPLAVFQAAAWIYESGMPVATYLDLLRDRLTEVLTSTRLPQEDYPHSAAATWLVALDELRRVDIAGAEILEICSFFGPDPIPMRLLYSRSVAYALTLTPGVPRDELAVAQVLRAINRFGLARSDQGSETLTVHRLVQAVIRGQVSEQRWVELRRVVHSALAGANPRDPDVPAYWSRYAELIPHLAPSMAASNPDPEVRKWIIDSVRYLWKRSLHTAAHELAERTLERWGRDSFGHPDDTQTLILRTELANILRSQGRLHEAYEIDRDVVERFRRTQGPESVYTLVASSSLGGDLRALGRYAEARELDESVLAVAPGVLGSDHRRTLMFANNLAMSEYLAGDRQAALARHRRSYEQEREVSGPNSLYALTFASNYARDLRETGDLAGALVLLDSTVASYGQILGDNHTDTLRARRNQAVALRRAGRYAEAKENDEDIHSRYVEAHGAEHPDTLAATCNLAADLAALGETDRALDLAERARRRYEDYLGGEHPVTLACANNLSVLRRLAGRPESARELSRHTLEQCRRVLGDAHPYTLTCMANHANDLVSGGELAAATALEEEAREGFLRIFGEDHYDTLGVTSNLSLSLRAAGRTEEADELRADALPRSRRTLGESHPTTKAVVGGRRLDADIEPPTT